MATRFLRYLFRLSAVLSIVLVIALIVPLLSVRSQKKHVFTSVDAVDSATVGLVFGAGLVNSSHPSDVLRDRLITASELFNNGKISTILVSGDNRTEQYSEPEVMRNTLIEEYGIPENVIYQDFGGRRTYDSCKRAHDLFGVERAILISQEYHLPRAVWTCRRLGIESKGVSATRQPYVKDPYYKKREIVAIYKAFFDIYINSPIVLGGAPMSDLDL